MHPTKYYQGHHPDGSSIQNHSAGPLYPFAIQVRDNPAGGYFWELIGPGLDRAIRFGRSEDASRAAERLLAVRDNEDAWAFELERVVHVGGVKLSSIQQSLPAVCDRIARGESKWASMSRVARVAVLMELARRRLELPTPAGLLGYSAFADYAAREVA